jgi:chorismate mutase
MNDLEQEREKIDRINSEIINFLGERMRSVKKIAEYKGKNEIPIRDEEREKKVLEKISNEAEKKSLDKKFVIDIFKKIIEHSVSEEEKENGRDS